VAIKLDIVEPDQPPKLGPDPENGQWHIGFAVKNGNVFIDFGGAIESMTLTPVQALILAGKIAHISGLAAGVTQTPEPPPEPGQELKH
jgi:hypothetical protein